MGVLQIFGGMANGDGASVNRTDSLGSGNGSLMGITVMSAENAPAGIETVVPNI